MGRDTSPDLENLLAEAISRHQNGELTKAEWAYMEVLEHDPQHIDALHLLGVIADQMGDPAVAIERVQSSLAIRPDQPVALNNLGNIFAGAERYEEAIDSYQKAIELKPHYGQAHHNLGNVYSAVGRPQDALSSYQNAVAANDGDIDSLLAIGTTLEALGQFEEAIVRYREALSTHTDSLPGRMRLGAVLRKLNRIDEAQLVYEEILEKDADNAIAQHLLAVCSPTQTPDKANAKYVSATFDGVAEEFESCLADLNYRVPAECEKLVRKHVGDPDGSLSVVDIGCGTGLCADFLRAFAERLVGVDLSTGMLEKAGEKKVYDELIHADLTTYLTENKNDFDLILSADTLIYIGDLRTTFAAVTASLRAGGQLVFSFEKLHDDCDKSGYRLNRFGRYEHSEGTIRDWLNDAQLQVEECTETKLRDEGGDAVMGYLVVARKL